VWFSTTTFFCSIFLWDRSVFAIFFLARNSLKVVFLSFALNIWKGFLFSQNFPSLTLWEHSMGLFCHPIWGLIRAVDGYFHIIAIVISIVSFWYYPCEPIDLHNPTIFLLLFFISLKFPLETFYFASLLPQWHFASSKFISSNSDSPNLTHHFLSCSSKQ